MPRIPRKGTRARALFDELLNDYHWIGWTEPRSDGHGNTTWGEAKAAYDEHPPEYPIDHGQLVRNPRRYSSMEVSRLLKRYANKHGRGLYQLKPEFANATDDVIELTDADIIQEAHVSIDALPPIDLIELHSQLGEINALQEKFLEQQRKILDLLQDVVKELDEVGQMKADIMGQIEAISGKLIH